MNIEEQLADIKKLHEANPDTCTWFVVSKLIAVCKEQGRKFQALVDKLDKVKPEGLHENWTNTPTADR